MKSFFEICHHELVLPSFHHFLALPNNQILISYHKNLQVISSHGEVISKLDVQYEPKQLYHFKNRQVIIVFATEIVHYNLDTQKVIQRIHLNNQIRQNVRQAGNWNGGLYYVLNDKLYNSQTQVIQDDLSQKIVQNSNKGNLIIYNQLKCNTQHPILTLSIPQIQDQSTPQLIKTQYILNLPLTNYLIIKILQTNQLLYIFVNQSINCHILTYSKSTRKIVQQFQLSNNIIQILRFEQQNGIAIVLTNINQMNINCKSLTQKPKQCIKIINLKQQRRVNQVYIPRMNRFSFCQDNNQMYFIEANKKSIHSYKFLSVGRTYMHLLVALKYDKIFKNEIIKHVLNVLLE